MNNNIKKNIYNIINIDIDGETTVIRIKIIIIVSIIIINIIIIIDIIIMDIIIEPPTVVAEAVMLKGCHRFESHCCCRLPPPWREEGGEGGKTWV